jgi:hypothetical protein
MREVEGPRRCLLADALLGFPTNYEGNQKVTASERSACCGAHFIPCGAAENADLDGHSKMPAVLVSGRREKSVAGPPGAGSVVEKLRTHWQG